MEPQVVILPVEQVRIGQRQRGNNSQVDAHIKELAGSIAADGLIHAIAVSKDYELIAGYCRLHAVKSLEGGFRYASAEIGQGFIPCVVVHQESEADRHRLELMENLRRKNLSPVEEAMAVAAMHAYFVTERGPNWTQAETGQAVDKLRGEVRSAGQSQREVADSILLSRFAEDEEVLAAPSKNKAVAIAKKKLEQSLTNALGAVVVLDQKNFTLFEGPCEQFLRNAPAEVFDGIIVDPPYGINADEFGEQAMATGHAYQDTEELAFSLASTIFHQGLRVCKPDAHLYLFCDPRNFLDFKRMAQEAGWSVFQTPLIWHKTNTGHAPIPGLFSRRYEAILFAYRGTRRLTSTHSDVFSHAVPANRLHAAGKPVELYEELMKLSFLPGEHVLDPCAGGGTVFRAAKLAKLRATGCELDPQSANLCRAAIAE